MAAGQKYNIKIDYTHVTGEADIMFFWTRPGLTWSIVPQTQLYPAILRRQRQHWLKSHKWVKICGQRPLLRLDQERYSSIRELWARVARLPKQGSRGLRNNERVGCGATTFQRVASQPLSVLPSVGRHKQYWVACSSKRCSAALYAHHVVVQSWKGVVGTVMLPPELLRIVTNRGSLAM